MRKESSTEIDNLTSKYDRISLHKKISKKKSSWCRDEAMNALADKVTNKECHTWYARALRNNYGYIIQQPSLHK